MRARNIKPGFFTNADLAELPAETRLLFIGLWLMADRAGRLRDRPKQIKMEVFPADSYDVDAMLNQLSNADFIVRYEVEKVKYIQIVNFLKHQSPHIKEKASEIPPYSGQAPDKHQTSTVQAPDKHQTSTSAAHLIPDSGFRIPDSGFLNEDSCQRSKSSSSKSGKDIGSKERRPRNSANCGSPSPEILPNVNREAWSEFDAYRRSTSALRKNWTPLAQSKAQALLADHSPAEQRAMVDTSIRSGWSGLFPEKRQARKAETLKEAEDRIFRQMFPDDEPNGGKGRVIEHE